MTRPTSVDATRPAFETIANLSVLGRLVARN